VRCRSPYLEGTSSFQDCVTGRCDYSSVLNLINQRTNKKASFLGEAFSESKSNIIIDPLASSTINPNHKWYSCWTNVRMYGSSFSYYVILYIKSHFCFFQFQIIFNFS